MNMLNNCNTKKSADNAAGGLASLADKCQENTKAIVNAQVSATGTRAPPRRPCDRPLRLTPCYRPLRLTPSCHPLRLTPSCHPLRR